MTPKKQDLVREIATRASAVDYWAFMHYLPNPDPVLKKMGKDIAAYREILSDSHVGGCVRRRKAAIKGLEWRLTPTGNKKVDEILTTLFERLPLNSIINQILDATLFGYQVLEVMWAEENGLLLPTEIVGKPQEWFMFSEENKLLLRNKKEHDGKPAPEMKFLLATQQADYINPYGRADLALCFWAATFKKGGLKFWLQFVEKYGTPWLIGKHPRQTQPHEIEDLLDSMEKMLGTAVAAIPNDSTVELVESSSKGGSSQVFDDFLRYCKSEIAIAILGQNQTTEAEANRASATAGLEVAKAIRDEDAAIVKDCFNQLLNWVCKLNFNLEKYPTFELFEQESIDKLQAERDQLLANIGVQFTEQYLVRTYGFEQGDITLVSKPNEEQKSTEFNESMSSIPRNIADSIVEQLEIEAESHVDNWLQAIQDRLASAESLEDFRTQLDSLIPELDFSEYAQVMAWASTSAELAGRFSVAQENQQKINKKER
ncbi:hypothetical protein CEP48_03165 [Mergibacter septicus]|uniref:Uncharacterized protein n=1 Tax=Mergibacter septicus TaxID=221402 RepID=A0A8E3S871_9PAST|nr:DUF935 domain-containing protein [Mergibacter septicus]AWX15224.1 hypothetical protein CEP47_03165 [Mergibacter septicus]QDJ14478.1 hypothetical protein CEP48_03165 [Mergibacter septicus]UTU48085.1 DUF935 family protein [Mergibacter septicus]WMR96303.1 DUF935 domain-containing protein [Mergibacter septicus]